MKGSAMGYSLRARGWLALVVLTGATAVAIPVASADTSVATVGPNGNSVLCLNGQQSTVNPSSTGNTNGLVIANSGSCTTSTASSTPSSQTGGGGSGAGGTTSTESSSQTSNTSATTTGSTTKSASAKSKSASSASTRRAAPASVLAGNAIGLKIAAIRYMFVRHGALSVLVTIRDAHKRLVRNAVVTLGAILGAKSTLSVARTTFTSSLGRASFTLPVRATMKGHRLLMSITAKTSHARAFTISSKLIRKPAR